MIKEDVNPIGNIRIPTGLFRDISLDEPPVALSQETFTKIPTQPFLSEFSDNVLGNHLLEEPLDKTVSEEPLDKTVLEESFQKKLQGLVKKKQARYEQTKPTYNVQDQNYRFHQEYVVTLAKYYNIPIPILDSNLTLTDLPRRKPLRKPLR